MSDWTAEFKAKHLTAEDAVAQIRSGFRIVVAQAACEPSGCMGKFHTVAETVSNVSVYSVLTLKPYPFFSDPAMKGIFQLCSLFHGPAARAAAKANTGTVDYVPNMLRFTAHDLLSAMSPDIFFGTCTPPDSNGNVSLGLGVCYEREMVEKARLVIMEVNDRLPRTFGDTTIHMRDVDYFVANGHEVPVLPNEEPDEVDLAIGGHVADLIEDGSTIQCGIGAMPYAVTKMLRGKKDLGVHTEMLIDGMLELFEDGVITNKQKTLLPDKFVCAFVLGSQRLYDWVNENAAVQILRGAWVNSPSVIRQNRQMVSLNACLMIDLTGQVNAEGFGAVHYSGVGGLMETATGAREGLDGLGKSIIGLRSTTREGISRIVSVMPAGSPVTLHKATTDYVVTEYGVAWLRAKTIEERARSLIGIAHPDVREQLKEEAVRVGYIP
jgi:acyl-CoA hydrolase